jgi:hypothetical protein
MSLILELWDMEKSFTSLGLRIQNTKEYLNSDLKNDEGFYTDGVVMFTTRVAAMTEQDEKTGKYTFSEPHQTIEILLDRTN